MIRIEEETMSVLSEYLHVSIAFKVRSKMKITCVLESSGRWKLDEISVAEAYVKNYDEGEDPKRWLRWNTENWRVFSAFSGDERVGGAIVAWNTPGVDMLEGRKDIAVLWDLRVAPKWRGRGVGSALFERAEEYAKFRGCNVLKIETQDINVGACRFYAKQGCLLAEVNQCAYLDFPNEIQLIWHKKLD